MGTDIETKIERVRAGFADGALASLDQRKEQLSNLRQFLVSEEDGLTQALADDLGKSAIEAFTTEIGFTINEIDHTVAHMDKWLAPTKVKLPLVQRPGSAQVLRDPLGTVLIIAPWNYPLQLVLAPLVPALACGNTAVLKPSEVASATASFLDENLGKYVSPNVVQVVTGAIPETTELLANKWDHIFYTGNGTVGRIVMKAAAEHLTPVTLELGGKSPAVVTASADIGVSARRIMWGKTLNAGQTCVAPDYVLVDKAIEAEFVTALARELEKMHGEDPSESGDFGRIINERHFDRLAGLVDAGGFGAKPIGGDRDRDSRYFGPTVLTDVDPDSAVMNEEIFGPILPVLTYDSLDEATKFISARDKPLALYVFSSDDDEVDQVLASTSSGGATVNHTLMHLAVPDLPFGGVGPSGMGAYHGKAGIEVFSHAKSVLRRGTKPDAPLAYPPYTTLKQKLLRKLV